MDFKDITKTVKDIEKKIPDDVKKVVHPILEHRIRLSYSDSSSISSFLDKIMNSVSVPIWFFAPKF